MAKYLMTFLSAADELRLEAAGESGQAMVEYSLILGFVAAVVVFALTPLGIAVSDLIEPVIGWL